MSTSKLTTLLFFLKAFSLAVRHLLGIGRKKY